jgi:hypothetical protein
MANAPAKMENLGIAGHDQPARRGGLAAARVTSSIPGSYRKCQMPISKTAYSLFEQFAKGGLSREANQHDLIDIYSSDAAHFSRRGRFIGGGET